MIIPPNNPPGHTRNPVPNPTRAMMIAARPGKTFSDGGVPVLLARSYQYPLHELSPSSLPSVVVSNSERWSSLICSLNSSSCVFCLMSLVTPSVRRIAVMPTRIDTMMTMVLDTFTP